MGQTIGTRKHFGENLIKDIKLANSNLLNDH